MHPHDHCSTDLAVDPRFEDDDFTRAAVDERRARTAHAHAAHSIFAILGGLFLLHVFGRRRRCC